MLESARLPPIVISSRDFDRLQNLVEAPSAPRDVSEYLGRELYRAVIGWPPTDGIKRVRMGDHVVFRDDMTGQTRERQLVYPAESNPAKRKISVLTPVGAALIGVGEGETITWPTRSGKEHRLTVLKVG